MQSEVSLRKGDCKEVRFSGKTVSAFFEYLPLYSPLAIPSELPETLLIHFRSDKRNSGNNLIFSFKNNIIDAWKTNC